MFPPKIEPALVVRLRKGLLCPSSNFPSGIWEELSVPELFPAKNALLFPKSMGISDIFPFSAQLEGSRAWKTCSDQLLGCHQHPLGLMEFLTPNLTPNGIPHTKGHALREILSRNVIQDQDFIHKYFLRLFFPSSKPHFLE